MGPRSACAYDEPVFLTLHRFGLTDALTAGGRMASGIDFVSGGGTLFSELGEIPCREEIRL